MADGAHGNIADGNDQKGAHAPDSSATGWAANFVGEHFGKKPEASSAADNPSTAGDVAQNIINHKGLGAADNAEKIAQAFKNSGKTPEEFTRDVNAELERRQSTLRVDEKHLTGNDADARAAQDIIHFQKSGAFPEEQNVGSVDYDPRTRLQRTNSGEARDRREHEAVVIAVKDSQPKTAEQQGKSHLPTMQIPPDL